MDTMKNNLTVILPCYNELSNVMPLINELTKYDVNGYVKRIIYVDDDSPDGTSEFIKRTTFEKDVLCIHRIGRQGLSSAVLEGLMLADSSYVAVMDADGQHSPANLLQMYELISNNDDDIIIGSRFFEQKKIITHTGLRHTISWLGNILCSKILKRQLSDPLTGFFIVKRIVFLNASRKINPTGFKILLDLLYVLRKSNIKLTEFQIDFRKRKSGTSKLDFGVVLAFGDQILNKISFGMIPEKFLAFSLVGLSGILVHFAVFYCVYFLLNLDFNISQISATMLAMTSNFTLNNIITYSRNKLRGFKWIKGLFIFTTACSLGFASNIGVASYLNSTHQVWWLSALSGVLVGTIFNFAMSNSFVWKK